MSDISYGAAVADLLMTGKGDVLISASWVNEKVAQLKRWQDPAGIIEIEPEEFVVIDGVPELHVRCTLHGSIALRRLPTPIPVTPSFTVAVTPTLRIDRATGEVYAAAERIWITNVQPLHGLPFGLGNYAQKLATSLAGTTINTSFKAAKLVGSGAEYVTRAPRRLIGSVGRGIGRGGAAIGSTAGSLAGRVVPKRWRRNKTDADDQQSEGLGEIPEQEVLEAVDEALQSKRPMMFGGVSESLQSMLLKMINMYLEQRSIFTLPHQIEGRSIRGSIEAIGFEGNKVKVTLVADELSDLAPTRNTALLALGGAGAGVAAVCLEWFFSGTFLWF